MNPAHVHLILNHLPLWGTIFGIFLLALAHARGSMEVARAGLAILIVTGLATILVFFSGHGAEEIVEKLPGTDEPTLEAHEEAGVFSLVGTSLVMLASIAALVVFRGRALARWALGSIVGLALVSVVTTAWVSNLGGKIRHPEITGAAPSPAGGEAEHDAH